MKYITLIAVALITRGIATIIHELLHISFTLALGGSLATDRMLGPFGIHNGHLTTWVHPGEYHTLSVLAVPVIVALLGLLVVVCSHRINNTTIRHGVQLGGTIVWLSEALYSMAITRPVIVDGTVTYSGDGVTALMTVGYVSMFPGALVIALGLLVLLPRVSFNGD